VATPREAIADALGELGVVGVGGTVTADMENHALRRLNDLLGQYAVDPGTISKVTRTEWTITSGTQDYDVGASQTVNFARPALIAVESIAFFDTTITPNQEFNRSRPFSEEEWAAVPVKALTDTYPQRAYYNPTTPYGRITLFPKPTGTTLKGVLYAFAAVVQLATTDLANTWALPDDYRRFLIKNLAMELAPAYKITPSQELKDQARESKAVVRAANFRSENMVFRPESLISPVCQKPAYDIQRG
jgi:hypothetical protein